MPRRKSLSLSRIFSSSASQSEVITPAPDVAWQPIGHGSEQLLQELESLYWDGVEAELENIVRTLKVWQQAKYAKVQIEDETDGHIHGFDTFLDQVSQETRAFAIRYGEEKDRIKDMGSVASQHKEYVKALADHVQSRKMEFASVSLKSAVRKSLQDIPKLSGMQQRTWMLLEAAGFLDIDKLIEHRPPLDKLGFWKRPAIPQLALSKFDDDFIPRFEPLHCMHPDCKDIIRGSMFVSANSEPSIICEECYRMLYYGKDSYVKAYKHCPLAKSITPPTSRNICHCKAVSHFDGTGKPLSLFPVSKEASHINATGTGKLQCGLLKLGDVIALSKYTGLQTVVGMEKPGKKHSIPLKAVAEKADKNDESGTHKISTWKPKSMKMAHVSESTLNDPSHRTSVLSTTTIATEAQADEDIPLFFRQFTEKYPFGNVHMALRVGPLVIENGVAHTKGGALVSVHEMPVFHERFGLHHRPNRELVVAGTPNRELWRGSRPVSKPKRFKAIMKQVAGVPFSGILSRELELQIVEDLLAASLKRFDDEGLHVEDQKHLLDAALQPVMKNLRTLLGSRVNIYLRSIAQRLRDPKTKLTWSARDNNCQSFCNSLVDRHLFEPLVNSPPVEDSPLYVMSFVCPDEGYLQRGVRSKFDVPNGLTEEYLLRFHFGRHDEADIIDTYQEYWYDWGAFGGPLYSYQDLYPWDCTEAYGRYPTRCGDCNLAKHVWAFPFDSWSMSSLHLARDKHMYAPAKAEEGVTSTGIKGSPQSWMRNRLTVLAANSILHRAAAAMARTKPLCKATAWLHQDGLRKKEPALARVKLGGIHRAQPCSHYFEAGVYNHYFIAPWALWKRDEQIEAYELLRDGRVKMRDVPRRTGGRFATREALNWDNRHDYPGFGGDSTVPGIGLVDVAAPGAKSADIGNQGSHLEGNNMGSYHDAFMDAGFPTPEAGGSSGSASQCGTGCGSSVCAAGPVSGEGGGGGEKSSSASHGYGGDGGYGGYGGGCGGGDGGGGGGGGGCGGGGGD